jgi:hypothetical protein
MAAVKAVILSKRMTEALTALAAARLMAAIYSLSTRLRDQQPFSPERTVRNP